LSALAHDWENIEVFRAFEKRHQNRPSCSSKLGASEESGIDEDDAGGGGGGDGDGDGGTAATTRSFRAMAVARPLGRDANGVQPTRHGEERTNGGDDNGGGGDDGSDVVAEGSGGGGGGPSLPSPERTLESLGWSLASLPAPALLRVVAMADDRRAACVACACSSISKLSKGDGDFRRRRRDGFERQRDAKADAKKAKKKQRAPKAENIGRNKMTKSR